MSSEIHREIIIHAGMHKTGTSSIQQTLSKIQSTDFYYPKWRHPNHSNLFALLYHEPLGEYHAFKNEGMSEKSLRDLKKAWLERFEKNLRDENHRKIIFSAEDMSGQRFQNAVERFKDHLTILKIPYRIILYVRPSKSLIQSSIQQLIKSGLADLDLTKHWPCYRKRLEFFDVLFGRENVTLRKFNKPSLYEGDVVKDFAHIVGFKVKETLNKARPALLADLNLIRENASHDVAV